MGPETVVTEQGAITCSALSILRHRQPRASFIDLVVADLTEESMVIFPYLH